MIIEDYSESNQYLFSFCCPVTVGRTVYLFFGTKHLPPSRILIYDMENRKIDEKPITNTLGSEFNISLTSHCIVHEEKLIYFFGGIDLKKNNYLNNCYNEIFVFDIENNELTKQKDVFGIPPDERFGSSLNHHQLNNSLYVYGGGKGNSFRKKDIKIVYNDLYRYNIYTKTWEVLLNTTGLKYSPSLMMHSSSLVGNKLFMFGGLNKNLRTTNSLYSLDLEKLVWRKIKYRGFHNSIPATRCLHNSFIINENNLMISDGVQMNGRIMNSKSSIYIFNLNNRKWKKIKLNKKKISKSKMIGRSFFYNHCQKEFVLIGGEAVEKETPYKKSNSYFILKLATNEHYLKKVLITYKAARMKIKPKTTPKPLRVDKIKSDFSNQSPKSRSSQLELLSPNETYKTSIEIRRSRGKIKKKRKCSFSQLEV